MDMKSAKYELEDRCKKLEAGWLSVALLRCLAELQFMLSQTEGLVILNGDACTLPCLVSCCGRHVELTALKKTHEVTDKNLAKATKVISKSKKAKELQGMVETYEVCVCDLWGDAY